MNTQSLDIIIGDKNIPTSSGVAITKKCDTGKMEAKPMEIKAYLDHDDRCGTVSGRAAMIPARIPYAR
jgi:hypothetical protein